MDVLEAVDSRKARWFRVLLKVADPCLQFCTPHWVPINEGPMPCHALPCHGPYGAERRVEGGEWRDQSTSGCFMHIDAVAAACPAPMSERLPETEALGCPRNRI